MESTEIKKYYEWVSGNRTGQVEAYSAESPETNMVYFESQRFVQMDRLNFDLKPISEEEYFFKLKYFPPAPEESQQAMWDRILREDKAALETLKTGESIKNNLPTPESNPISIILDKQKKKDKIATNFEFELEIPNEKVLDLLDMMFDRDELIEEIVKSAISKIDSNAILDSIKEQIKSKVLDVVSKKDE